MSSDLDSLKADYGKTWQIDQLDSGLIVAIQLPAFVHHVRYHVAWSEDELRSQMDGPHADSGSL